MGLPKGRKKKSSDEASQLADEAAYQQYANMLVEQFGYSNLDSEAAEVLVESFAKQAKIDKEVLTDTYYEISDKFIDQAVAQAFKLYSEAWPVDKAIEIASKDTRVNAGVLKDFFYDEYGHLFKS
jgi:hypothetical protein